MAEMDILADVRRKLDRDKRSLQQLARASGVPFSTLRYIKTGATASPRIDTLMKLRSFLARRRISSNLED